MHKYLCNSGHIGLYTLTVTAVEVEPGLWEAEEVEAHHGTGQAYHRGPIGDCHETREACEAAIEKAVARKGHKVVKRID